MARVQKRIRSDGRSVYVVKWRTPDGKDRSKGGFTTKKLAEAYATKAEGAALTGVEFDPNAGKMLFREAAEVWLQSRAADLKPTTLVGHRYALAPSAQRHGDGKTLGIDAEFGGYPLNHITREQIQTWVSKMVVAKKKPSTVRHAFFTVRMVLGQAVADGRLSANPATYVKLPSERSNVGVVDDPAQFLTAAQVSALVATTPWPYNVYVHVAAWSGLRAAELCGLQIGDLDLPDIPLNPNAPTKPGTVRVQRTVRTAGADLKEMEPKTKASRRRVPLPRHTTELLRDYLTAHPRANEPAAPLFPGMTLVPPRPRGVRVAPVAATEVPVLPGTAATAPAQVSRKAVATRQATALAALSVGEAEARLQLNWAEPLRHMTFYKAVYQPAILRANRRTPMARLAAGLKFHSLRHTYASLCAAAGRPPLEVSRFMGHTDVKTTLSVYTHLFATDDHAGAMDALNAMAGVVREAHSGNVLRLHG
jgi:integrase